MTNPKPAEHQCPRCSFSPTNMNDFCDEHRPKLGKAEPPSDERREIHANCHDLVCSGSRAHPRGTKGQSCSCKGRDFRSLELEQQLADLTRELDEARKQHAIIQRNHGEAIGREALERIARKAAVRERDEARAQLEREQIRLAACATAALGNTPEQVAKRIEPDHPYYSASYGDVCRAVDREIEYREIAARLGTALEQAEHTIAELEEAAGVGLHEQRRQMEQTKERAEP